MQGYILFCGLSFKKNIIRGSRNLSSDTGSNIFNWGALEVFAEHVQKNIVYSSSCLKGLYLQPLKHTQSVSWKPPTNKVADSNIFHIFHFHLYMLLALMALIPFWFGYINHQPLDHPKKTPISQTFPSFNHSPTRVHTWTVYLWMVSSIGWTTSLSCQKWFFHSDKTSIHLKIWKTTCCFEFSTVFPDSESPSFWKPTDPHTTLHPRYESSSRRHESHASSPWFVGDHSSPLNWGIRCPVIRYNLRDQPHFLWVLKRSSQKCVFFIDVMERLWFRYTPIYPSSYGAFLWVKSLFHHPKQKPQHSTKFHLLRICWLKLPKGLLGNSPQLQIGSKLRFERHNCKRLRTESKFQMILFFKI